MTETRIDPALVEWTGLNGLPRFDLVKDEAFAASFDATLASHEAEIDAIANNPDPATFEMEGPFGEYTGYYGGDQSLKHRVKVTCITHRNNPIFRGTLDRFSEMVSGCCFAVGIFAAIRGVSVAGNQCIQLRSAGRNRI